MDQRHLLGPDQPVRVVRLDPPTRGRSEHEAALTVEPGIYIRPSPDIPKEFWNIGVRIEDDVLVTAEAPEVLTAALEKTPDAIESLR